MSERRRHVFVEKVLKRLFPNVPSGQKIETAQTLPLEILPRKATSEKVEHNPTHQLTDGDVWLQSERRLYTVSMPPEGHVLCPSGCRNAESTCGDADAKDQDPCGQPKRRIRKHKSKKILKNSSNVHIDVAELEKPKNFFQELQSQATDGPIMSKNKKRKLKKKQQMRRRGAAGEAAKASGASFTYQPQESSSEQEDTQESAPAEARGDSNDVEMQKRKVEGILNFLKSTQEIYFYDGAAQDANSAFCAESAAELLTYLESHRMPPSDMFILDHMRTLLLLHDTESLKRALEMFPKHCVMPPDHAKVISDFFNYWITHIFPEKDSE